MPFKRRRTAHASGPQSLKIGHGFLTISFWPLHTAASCAHRRIANPRTHGSPCRVVRVIAIHPHPRSGAKRIMLEPGLKPTAMDEVHKAATLNLVSKKETLSKLRLIVEICLDV